MSDLESTTARRGLSIFLQTPPDGDPGRIYRGAIDAIVLAERLGYSTAWLAEAHFAPIGLPAALPVLAVAAERTSHIRLGTGVVPLIFDNPIRLAEQAAVTDALTGGRLELGIGKGNSHGFSTPAFRAFRFDEDDKQDLYAERYDQLKVALRGSIDVGGERLQLYPPPQSLLPRIWQATATAENAAAIGREGDGLLLHRLAFEGHTGTVQFELIERYLEAYASEFDAAPRIGVSRSVLPAASRAAALALIQRDFARNPRQYTGFGATSPEEFLERSNVTYGDIDDVIEGLQRDAAVAHSTEYLFSIPLPNGSPEFVEALELIADRIYPELPVGAAVPTR
jgi:alkanesulfonate monooxygenase SsuD/methylene tetrahydromethanopterin reductase-like flavin-dependent oxidoreductase (luciferase family)